MQHSHIVRAVAFPAQPRPAILATGGAEKKLRIFDLSRSSPTFPASPNDLNGVTNGTKGSTEATTLSHEIGAGVHGGTIKSIVWGMDPNVLITAADDKKIRWWDLRSRSVLGEFELDGVVGSCEMNCGPSDFGAGVLSVAAGKSVYFFDGSGSRRLLKSIKTPHEIASVALHPDKKRFVTGGSGDTWVRMYDYDEGKELGRSMSSFRRLFSGAITFDITFRSLQGSSRTYLVR